MNFRTILSAALSLALFAGLALSSGCAKTNVTAKLDIPAKYRKAVEETIERSGENAHQIQLFLSLYRNDRKMLEAASFLIANLPVSDAASMTADELSENLDYAFKARREMPWGRTVPWETFLHFVLPHRVSGETHQRWRRRFFEELAPLVMHCKTMREAILEVNKWATLQTSYKPSSWRDQGPITTILKGWGRCEEIMIVFICGARSVGIPARQCYTPSWQHCNSNHAWVEVWTDDKGWQFLGSSSPLLAAGESWVTNAAKHAIIVLSTCYGRLGKTTDELVYREGRNYTIINSTPVYTTPCDVKVTVLGKDGNPMPRARVFFGVYNFGYFGPVAAFRCDEQGKGSVVLGEGTVLVSTACEDGRDCEFVHVKPGAPVEVTLDIRKNRYPHGEIWARFHHWEGTTAPEMTPELKEKLARYRKICGNLNNARLARLASHKELAARYLKIDPNDEKAWEEPLAKALLTAAGNCGEIIRALAAVPPEYRDALVERLTRMDDKDLLETTASELLIGVPLAVKAREVLAEKGFLTYPDDVFYDYVLTDRIYRENHADWRPLLYERFSPYVEEDLMLTVRRVNEYTSLLKQYDDGIFGGVMNPLEVVRSGAVTREMERAIAAVGILRAIGIPARYLEQWGWLEFFDGKEWKPFYPSKPDKLGDKKAVESAGKVYAEPAVLRVSFFRYGKPLDGKQYAYFRDFNIAVFNKNGYFRYFEPEGEFDSENLCYVLKLPPGEYFLMAGRRNTYGEPYVRIFRLECKAGDEISLRVDTDLPVDKSLPVVRELKELPDLKAATLGGDEFDLKKTLQSGKSVVLAFFDTTSEPCVSMMPLVNGFAGRRGVKVVGVCVDSDRAAVERFVSEHCPKIAVILDGKGTIRNAFKAGTLPSILVIRSDGKVIMWTEGHNLQIDEILRKALGSL